MTANVNGLLIEIPKERIPRAMFVHCPKVGKLVRVQETCTQCPCFNHFVESDERAEQFKDRYRLICGHPLARRMTEVDA